MIVLAVALGVGLLLMPKDNRPCVRYDTSYSIIHGVPYPYQYCAQYGEWVGDGPPI